MKNKLYGFESLNEFNHITDIEIYNKFSKNNKSFALSLSKYLPFLIFFFIKFKTNGISSRNF